MSDIVERLRDSDTTRRIGESYADVHDRRQADRDEAADEITRLTAENEKLRALAAKADEAIARQQQDLEEATDRAADCDTLRAEVEKLRAALRGVVRVADRDTAEFNEARTAIKQENTNEG